MNLSVLSKTFLLGEYIALTGGPVLLLNTEPKFQLVDMPIANGIPIKNIAAESPAGKLYQDYLHDKNYYFVDPHQGRGGLGASSAQFVLLAQALGITDPWQIWEKYRQYTKEIPSGADVIAQAVGGLVFFHREQKIIESLIWPFANIDIALIHTGKKLATHEYLNNFKNVDFNGHDIVVNACRALKEKNSALLIDCVNQYAAELERFDLVAAHTKKLLTKIKVELNCLAAKGCGALGADVILVLLPKTEKEKLAAWVKKQQLSLIFCGNQL